MYQAYYAVYRRLYERTKEEMHDLARLTAATPHRQDAPLGRPMTAGAS